MHGNRACVVRGGAVGNVPEWVTRWPLTLPPTDEKLLKGLMNGDYRELSEVTGLRRFVANLAAHVATAAAIK